MPKHKLEYYGKSTCSTCRKARSFLLDKNAELTERDLGKEPMAVGELESLIGERAYLDFLNTRNELYRSMKMKADPPSRREALSLMAKNPNLIRRPILRRGNDYVLGFDAEKFAKLVK